MGTACGKPVSWSSAFREQLDYRDVIRRASKVSLCWTPKEGSKALGVWITFDGHFTKELAEREVSAWQRFYALRQLLCDNNVALKYRLRVLTSCVVSPMRKFNLHTHTMCTSARCTGSHAEKMIYVRRLPDESAETHMTRWARLLRNCRAKHKLQHGDESFFASYFSWCGRIARITTRDPKRDVLFLRKNMIWLRRLKSEMGSHCYGRRFRVWRWEQAVAQCLGYEWLNVAQNSTEWRSTLEEMINRKKQKWLIARVLKSSDLDMPLLQQGLCVGGSAEMDV